MHVCYMEGQQNWVNFDHPQSGVLYNFAPVCLSVCQTITLESLDVGSSFSLIRYISMEYGSNSYMKVIGLFLA